MNILRNILFFLLLFVVGFFLGLLVAGLVDAGKGQMLAGGAIVFGYGVVGAGAGLILAIMATLFFKLRPAWIVFSNKILAIVLICLWLFFYVRYERKQAEKTRKENETIGMLLDTGDYFNY
ncbi:MAG: hypothetical protein AAGA77_05750 [Bacteroidota bacterium]